jgi:hypothetical protein
MRALALLCAVLLGAHAAGFVFPLPLDILQFLKE